MVLIKKHKLKNFNSKTDIVEEDPILEEELLTSDQQDILISIRERVDLETQSILEQARNEAFKIINSAKEEAKQGILELEKSKQVFENSKQDYQLQLDEAKQKIQEEAFQKADSCIHDFMEIIKNFHTLKQKMLSEIQGDIVNIAFELAKKIIGHEAIIDQNLLEKQIFKALEKIDAGKGLIQIFVNEEDHPQTETIANNLSKLLDPDTRLIFVKDSQIHQGSCIIKTQGGSLDGNFHAQLESLKFALERQTNIKIEAKAILQDFEAPIIEIEEKPKEEPSDEDLDLIEDNFESYLDLDIEKDLDQLLGNVVLNDNKDMKETSKKAKSNKTPLEESDDLGANEYYNGDDLDIEEDDDFEEDEDLEEEQEFEDENFAEDDDDSSDERFPEY